MPNDDKGASGKLSPEVRIKRGNGVLSFALPVATHTESGVAELVRIEIWRRNAEGQLVRETELYGLAISQFDYPHALTDGDFNRALCEAGYAASASRPMRSGQN